MKKIKKIAALFGAGATVIAGKKLYDKYKYKNLSQKKEIQIPHFMKNTLNVLRIFAVH